MMEKAGNPRQYISTSIRLDFYNDSNLKQDIQNRMSDKTEIRFQNAINNLQGDNKESIGDSLSEVTKLAMAYFFESIFPKGISVKNNFYTLQSIKGFMDACNHTSYTPIHELDATYYKLRHTAMFKHCWLIIQAAWFFNSSHFGHHQYIDYINHYSETEKKLSIEAYKLDKEYLEKKYRDIDKEKKKGKQCKEIYGYKIVEQWYYFILFIIAKELDIKTSHFKQSKTDFREYTPITKCPRQLRSLVPFKLIECDIKSAFPSFLDALTGTNLRAGIYANLMKRKNISRSEAKILFNKQLNSGKYKTKEQTKQFLLECGYTSYQSDTIVQMTHDPDRKFVSHMCELEDDAINQFREVNNLQRGSRLHDSLIFIDDKIKPKLMFFENDIVEFGLSELNQPILKQGFRFSDKWLPYAYISSIPATTENEIKAFIKKKDFRKPKKIGDANSFRFYAGNYKYISAAFNLNKKYSYKEFLTNCRRMFATLEYLNERKLKTTQIYLMLLHIRAHSNIIFNVRYTHKWILKMGYEEINVKTKDRDYDFLENLIFKEKIEFLNALNKARGIVNRNQNLYKLFCRVEKHISEDDFSFLDMKFKGKKANTLIVKSILKRFNYLRTGKHRKPKAQTDKRNPLYSNLYKEGSIKVIEPHKFTSLNRNIKRKIEKYENELKALVQTETNKRKSDQYLHIIGELVNIQPDLDILRNEEAIRSEIRYLMQEIDKCEYSEKQAQTEF
ncbi:MAG TPA: hypothetical protein VFM72_03590, partial [Aequorivita sp.]|nr:hypothetical protein [Aequorivita sp.]